MRPQSCRVCSIQGHDFFRMWRPFTLGGMSYTERASRGQNALCPDCYRQWQKENPGEQSDIEDCKVCDVVTAHHDSLIDDPERLTSDFILGMVGTFHQQKYRRKRTMG
jgi:hypothetical protein